MSSPIEIGAGPVASRDAGPDRLAEPVPEPERGVDVSASPRSGADGARGELADGKPSAARDARRAADDDPDAHPLVRDILLNPRRWRIWPAVAVLRWLQRRVRSGTRRIVFRSSPSLGFPASEVDDLHLGRETIELVLNAPGLATPGSPLPSSDIARIVADYREGGPLSAWLDGPGDRFMHAVELAQLLTNPAYALLTGERVEAFALIADLVGRSAPLSAARGGRLSAPSEAEPEGAIGLASLYTGNISAAGLGGLYRAFTGLPTRIVEFAGAAVEIGGSARLGAPLGRMLGVRCRMPAAGVEVRMDGASRPEAQEWARDAVRRRSLHLLATSYIGAPSPAVRILLSLNADNAPPAALDGGAALGGLAVLGPVDERVELPLHG